MSSINPNIEESWKELLKAAFKKESFEKLKKFIIQEREAYQIYPKGQYIFNAFNLTPLNNVKLVIIGQDPYHGPDQAHGLSFSVQNGVKHPPSLRNIFKELKSDLNIPVPTHGNLEKWARQGVLLLNATLTVRQGEPGSHQGKGWEEFTDETIVKLSEHHENLIFLLWGKFAQNKKELINSDKHLVLSSAHPSPFSADRGFFGCKHFSKANAYLASKGIPEIDWQLE